MAYARLKGKILVDRVSVQMHQAVAPARALSSLFMGVVHGSRNVATLRRALVICHNLPRVRALPTVA
jgi:hypothetical protein